MMGLLHGPCVGFVSCTYRTSQSQRRIRYDLVFSLCQVEGIVAPDRLTDTRRQIAALHFADRGVVGACMELRPWKLADSTKLTNIASPSLHASLVHMHPRRSARRA
jgi:hypothetical protein